ncbi:c-type cytochrome [Pseudomonas sp. BN102]|uniref:c-type cytochrome n=1 Tax=Pseudomonas sp. BN102 TaxID=2567886 RepID=UPI0024583B15|nr:c-type cytochrome [Pseudomonas sp. BN102]MDH4612024.1 c-type cytochrome [Pseudomonas sp. BN102]
MRNPFKRELALGLLFLGAAGAAQADDLALAEKLTSNHCAVCHTFKQGEPHGQGPNLYGLIGRKAGGAAGFTYSEGFRQAMADKTWDNQLLDAWLTDTQTVAPGNAMTYFQDDPAKRARIIQYVQSLH